jgi:hypothetical protein
VGEVFVVNASPVITLAKAGHLTLLTDLANAVFLPDAVVVGGFKGSETCPVRRAFEGERHIGEKDNLEKICECFERKS